MRADIAISLLAWLVFAPGTAEARSLLQNATEVNGLPALEGVEDFKAWMIDVQVDGRADIFKALAPVPAPNGTYQAFLISDSPIDGFGLSGTQKAILSFVVAGFLGKTFSGDGAVANVLSSDGGFDPKALAGTISMVAGFVDGNDSWVTRFPGTINDFIVDEFREVQEGFLIGRTYFGPKVELGDRTMFESGLVRLALTLPEGKTATEVIQGASGESEENAAGISAEEGVDLMEG